MERQLIADYFALVTELSAGLDTANHALAVELAGLPDMVRGFGHVKLASITKFERRKADLLAKWRAREPLVHVA
jgi:indolepyruvate ferredoxin oxidoreductase